jgi:hypothetical protein
VGDERGQVNLKSASHCGPAVLAIPGSDADRAPIRNEKDGRSMTVGFRVVFGNEPQFYRGVLAEAVRCLRPDLEVILIDPTGLDEEVGRAGAVVVCSRLSPDIRTQALAWVLLYPDAENRANVGIAGEERTISGFEIADLLAVIDEAASLFKDDGRPGADAT